MLSATLAMQFALLALVNPPTRPHSHVVASGIIELSVAITACFLLAYVSTPLVRLYRHRKELCPRIAAVGRVWGGTDLMWAGEPVDHICRTIFVLWNGGWRPISLEEFSKADPVRVGVAGRLLEYAVFEPAPGVHIRRSGNSLELTVTTLAGMGPPPDAEVSDERVVGVQLIHDSPDWVPAVSGQIGAVSLENVTRKGKLIANPGRPLWMVLLATAVAVAGFLADLIDTGRIENRWVWIGVAIATAVVVEPYIKHYVRFGAGLMARPGDDSYSDDYKEDLWLQRVPYRFRGRSDLGDGRFWKANEGRWSQSSAPREP